MTDMVNHPPHYNNSKTKCECGRRIECIDVTRHMPFNLGNAVKYIWRWQDKGGIEDLKKALWYLKDYIEHNEFIPKNQNLTYLQQSLAEKNKRLKNLEEKHQELHVKYRELKNELEKCQIDLHNQIYSNRKTKEKESE